MSGNVGYGKAFTSESCHMEHAGGGEDLSFAISADAFHACCAWDGVAWEQCEIVVAGKIILEKKFYPFASVQAFRKCYGVGYPAVAFGEWADYFGLLTAEHVR